LLKRRRSSFNNDQPTDSPNTSSTKRRRSSFSSIKEFETEILLGSLDFTHNIDIINFDINMPKYDFSNSKFKLSSKSITKIENYQSNFDNNSFSEKTFHRRRKPKRIDEDNPDEETKNTNHISQSVNQNIQPETNSQFNNSNSQKETNSQSNNSNSQTETNSQSINPNSQTETGTNSQSINPNTQLESLHQISFLL
jgi:hypothetical protein